MMGNARGAKTRLRSATRATGLLRKKKRGTATRPKGKKPLPAGVPIALALAIVLLVVGLGAFAMTQRAIEIDPTTNCPFDANIPTHTVILVDSTNVIPQSDYANLVNIIEREARNLEIDGRLSMFAVGADSSQFGSYTTRLFSYCNPGTRKDFSPLNDNPEQRQAKWREQFGEPLRQQLNELRNAEEAETTPLLEALREVSQFDSFSQDQADNRKLIVFSDMLHHTEEFSQYDSGYSLKGLVETSLYRNSLPKFVDVDVALYLIVRQEKARNQDENHSKFWSGLFEFSGASDFKRLP